ncbi:MAG: CRTAC1 family protein [Planctomycetes bacterium]|nr:CRTAC1 family protein [Planctomycetota bacterium]
MNFMLSARSTGLCAIAILSILGCKKDAEVTAPEVSSTTQEVAGPAWFEECAADSGLDFQHVSGHGTGLVFPEIMSTGIALFDMDGDGDLDVYLVQGGSWSNKEGARDNVQGNQLYANDGEGLFTNVTAGSGADDKGYGMGVATGDYDGDGDVDLYVSNLNSNVLLRNDGNGHFTEVTESAGVGHAVWSASSAFVDYDRDGDLDLFVTNYIYWDEDSELPCQDPPRGLTYCSPKSYDAPTPDVLYRNDGDGTFTDVSLEVGLRSSKGNGLGVLCADFDGDGYQEIFVANDGTPNKLWVVGSDGKLTEKGLIKGCAVDDQGRAKAGMGVSAADLDFDGDEDLLVVNLKGEDDSLYRNDGGRFSDRTPRAGLAHISNKRTRFGVVLRDFDHDGFIDIYQANGHVTHPIQPTEGDPFADHNNLIRGLDKMRFELVSPQGGVAQPLKATSRSAAFGDIDGDGDLDLFIHNRDIGVHLLRNIAPKQGHWILIQVLENSGAPAIGATFSAKADDKIMHRQVRTAESYCAASDPRLHFGLGTATRLTEIQITWSDGQTESFGTLASDKIHTLRRGNGRSE